MSDAYFAEMLAYAWHSGGLLRERSFSSLKQAQQYCCTTGFQLEHTLLVFPEEQPSQLDEQTHAILLDLPGKCFAKAVKRAVSPRQEVCPFSSIYINIWNRVRVREYYFCARAACTFFRQIIAYHWHNSVYANLPDPSPPTKGLARETSYKYGA